ncbi:16S rRNA (cytosine(1402)-N(4))-methyltransferase RsmH [Verrucomicrobiota bacterium]
MHQPVLVDEVVDLLPAVPGGTYVDGTVGSGGHAEALLRQMKGKGRLLAIDRDADALARAQRRLAPWDDQLVFVHGNHSDIGDIARSQGIHAADGILLDLGVSSEQLDTPERGFSVIRDGKLDMRMNRANGRTAADLVNELPREALRSLIRDFGEERAAGRVARALTTERAVEPILTTGRLAAVVARAVGGRRRLHPATRVFQALRIAVNEELESLSAALTSGLDLLAPGGRIAVISFHSLEDRIVKNTFRCHAGRFESLPAGGQAWRGEEPAVRLVNAKPVTPSEAERTRNPRSRSAKLRVAERRD